MADENIQKKRDPQPPKINLNGNGGPAESPSQDAASPTSQSTPPRMRIQPKTEKKETVRIDIGQSQFPTVLSPSAADDTSKKTTTRIDAAAGMKPLKKSTIRIETPLEMNPMAEDDRYAAAKKATVRIETAAEMSPMSEQDKQEAAKKSTVRVQVDEEKAKGDTAKLNMRTAVVDQEAKKKTSRIDLKEVLDGEEEDIFKRRTALLDASKFQAVASESASAAGVSTISTWPTPR